MGASAVQMVPRGPQRPPEVPRGPQRAPEASRGPRRLPEASRRWFQWRAAGPRRNLENSFPNREGNLLNWRVVKNLTQNPIY